MVPLRSFASSDVLPPQARCVGARPAQAGARGSGFAHSLVGFARFSDPSVGADRLARDSRWCGRWGHKRKSARLCNMPTPSVALPSDPEFLLSTSLSQTPTRPQNYTNMELLLAQYNIARVIQVGPGGSIGILRQPGTPDARGLFADALCPAAQAGDGP